MGLTGNFLDEHRCQAFGSQSFVYAEIVDFGYGNNASRSTDEDVWIKRNMRRTFYEHEGS